MSKTVRIRTTPNGDDSYLKVKVEQDFDFIEILSLKISQEEAYARFCSDYGVIVGRVIVNNGLGIPNAKVSVFVPISDIDREDSEIVGLYPFDNIDDTDSSGVRYNLLQKDGKSNEACFTPIGTFPSKREVIDNDTVLEVYEKYYKFTTTTNDAGDYMIFGVPTGPHTVNVDVDLSDIGIASQRPYDYIAQGEDKKRFETPNKFKGDKDLDKLMQVKSFKKGVNVQPFWGDKEQCDIGISRLDVDVKKNIIPSAIFIGSLFSDSEKNSVNKQCRPRKDFGRLCETETGEGTVEMIRKNLDGKIERFDIEGGRVIDSAGTWAYQIPMNLDYMITDEFGNLVPSEDPNKGVPTRSSVRFRVGKDITGGEGRLRTTAKYLVPHNPTNSSDIDYNFDENTGSNHFRDFHWNKIYTISNYIPRIQPLCSSDKCADNRNMTGIKDVDGCSGLKTPFPYNRVDTDFNPLFLIICILLTIITTIVWLINSTIVRLINIILSAINAILSPICSGIWAFSSVVCPVIYALCTSDCKEKKLACRRAGCVGDCEDNSEPENDDDYCTACDCSSPLGYVPCITLECADEDYGPGCDCSSSSTKTGCYAAENSGNPKNIVHWSGLNFTSKNCGHEGHGTAGAGVTDCFAIKLADALNMFEFDFYNDWINGTLYTYLLKYKKKKNGKRKFCDSECDSPDSDNGCDKSFFVDTAIDDGDTRDSIKYTNSKEIDEGFVKIVVKKLSNGLETEDLYYSPYSVDANEKLFATELVHLGSIFDCDWQGIPKLQPFLVPTSYKRPPYTDEYMDDNSTKIACGITSTGGGGKSGLFFDIDCAGLIVGLIDVDGVDLPRVDSLKRICEHGVNIDEAEFDSNNAVVSAANCYIDNDDIVDPWGGLFRDVFMQLNVNDGPTKLNSWPVTGLPAVDTTFQGTEYKEFRGVNATNAYKTDATSDDGYTQSKNSFFFYFGTNPATNALTIMNRKYFTECEVVVKNDFIVSGIITDASNTGVCDGEIATTVVGGNSPYTYVWTGPNGFSLTESVGDITGLCDGIYNLTVTDDNGGTSTISFTVNEPPALSCTVTSNPAINFGGEGEILISAFGGVPNYTYSINGGTPVVMTSSYETVPYTAGTHTVTVGDSNGGGCDKSVTITEPSELSLGSKVTWVHTSCGSNDGVINIGTFGGLGGITPYSFLTTGPNSFSSTLTNMTSLEDGTYTVQVTDSSPTPQVDTQTVTINSSIGAKITHSASSWYCWEYGGVPQIYPTLTATANGGFTINANPLDNLGEPTTPVVSQTYAAGTTSPTLTGLLEAKKYRIDIIDDNGCESSRNVDFNIGGDFVPEIPMRIELTNASDKYCWISGDVKQIKPKFAVYTEGAFTIKNGTTTIYTSAGVSLGTVITITTPITVPSNNTVTITLTDTVHNCTTQKTINFSSQVPSTALSASASQTVTVDCISATTQTGTIVATPTGGWGGNSYRWYQDNAITSRVTASTTLDSANCGKVWKCLVTDTEGCSTWTNSITIT